MDYTPINKSSIVSGGTISKSNFGDVTADNFDNHETRILANVSSLNDHEARITTIEASSGLAYAGGKWRNASTTGIPQNNRIPFATVVDTATGVTKDGSHKFFTVTEAARYDMHASLHVTCPSAGNLWLILTTNAADGTVTEPWYGGKVDGIPSSGDYVIQAEAMNIPLAASATIAVYAWYSGGTVSPVSPNRHATTFSIRKVA